MINEFKPYGSSPWIEIINTDENTDQDLTGWTILDGNGQEFASLSGTIIRQSLLTFDLETGLNPGGDCLILSSSDSDDDAVDAVWWGNGSCPQSVTVTRSIGALNPDSDQSLAMITNSNNWFIDDTPTKGWCNDELGGCPTISYIVDQLAAEGITTNLADFSDYSRLTGLYFERSNYGKITFLREMNFTNTDIFTWLSTLGEKIDLSTKARIELDADLIKNLVDTQAQLTMYGLSFNNPKVLVNGAEDTEGIVSGLAYSGGTLTFTAAHFTVFTAVESSPSSGGSSGPPVCGDWPPTGAPHLFQINTSANSATLYFTPVKDHLSYYFIAYGYSPDDVRFGIEFPASLSTGVESYTINHLSPQTKYYFKVRGGNGCAPGEWSNVLAASTEAENETPLPKDKKSEEKEFPEEETLVEEEETLSEIPQEIQISPSLEEEEKPKEEVTLPSKEVEQAGEEKASFFRRLINWLLSLFKIR